MDRDYSMYEPLFGSWHITKKIGSGADGSVFEIQRTDAFGITEQSALKAVTIPAGGEEEIKEVLFSGVPENELKAYYEKIIEGVANEFRCMTSLKGNSHIVSYEDHQIIPHDGDIGWDILMRVELLTPLLDYYQDRQMDETDILKMGRDLCMGLESCRQFGIVHRDIKPANIFIAPSGDYKLGDFGIAKIVESTQSFHSRKGTYTYMAPEVYRGEAYGETVDLYSLGMVLYQCLNDGRSPFLPAAPATFSRDDVEEAFAKRIACNEVPPPAHGSEDLKRIVQKACAFDPADRYPSAKAMRLELEKLMRQEDAEVEPEAKSETAGAQPDRKTRRLKRWILAAAAVLLCGSALAWAMIPHEIESIEGIDDQTEIYIGDTLQPEYHILPERFADEPIAFEVTDAGDAGEGDVIGVSGTGAITAQNLGKAAMTMTADEYSRTVRVTVIPKVTSIRLVDEEDADLPEDAFSMVSGSTMTVKPVLRPDRFSDEKTTWTLKDPSIAGVSTNESDSDQKVTLTALAAGETVLTVGAGGCSVEVPVIVTDPPPQYNKSSGNSKSSKKSKKSKSNSKSNSNSDKGYFKDSDKEYF